MFGFGSPSQQPALIESAKEMKEATRMPCRVEAAVRRSRSISAALLATIMAGPGWGKPVAPDQLERAIIVMRHGVRSAMTSPVALAQWNGRPWPAFAVPPGHLTTKGGRLIALMGRYYRLRYQALGLLRNGDCSAYYRANLTQRTHATASALAEGLTPDCSITIDQMASGPDPLFDAPRTASAPSDAERIRAAIAGRIGNDLTAWDARQRANLGQFEALLLHCTGPCTEADRARASKRFDRVPIGWSINSEGMPLPTSPALQVAGIAESLLMGYADGHDFAKAGWGFDAARLTDALVVHGAGIDLRLRTPEVGRQSSSYLARSLVATLQTGTVVRAREQSIGGDQKIVVLSGHDSTLNQLAGLLGLEWLLPSYAAGQAAPGGGLVFERWRRGRDGVRVVRIYYIAQGLSQLRDEVALSLENPPEMAAVAVPGCAVGSTLDCPISDFSDLVRKRSDPARAGPYRTSLSRKLPTP